VEFRILGPLEVWHEGKPLAVTGARQRELLVILLLHAGQVVSTDRLMDALWGDDQPAAGATALRVRVSQLRRTLGPGGDLLVTRPRGYALLVPPGSLDLRLFERHLEDATRTLAAGAVAEALEHAHAALALWRGEPLADLAYATYTQPAIARLEEMRAAALELRIEAELALGRHRQVTGELHALVSEHPLRERLWAQLMLALYRDGRQADALAAYRTARARLVEEIGIEPGPELKVLEARVLAQDPALAIGTPALPAGARRCVLALGGETAVGVAKWLARRGGHELLVVELVRSADEIGVAAARLADLRAAAIEHGVEARVAAFTTADRGADAVRMATEQDAALLVVDAQDEIRGDLRTILAGAVCDVAMVAGAGSLTGEAVLVPFAGHDHDWSAAEVAAWLAGDAPLRLLGARRRGTDASRLLASVSLALQRGIGIVSEPVLVEPGPDAVLAAAAEGVSAIVIGLSQRWTRDGIGRTRLEIARRAPCPVLLVRGGLRPSGLAPAHALTRFTWSGGD
jgi:DNA-binding SARP family transcriptional activator